MPIAVLFYHRVADDCSGPWTISTDGFRRQVDWLARHFDLVSLEEVQRRVRSGFNDRPTVSITFDDGYADNSAFALPLLIKRGIPVTYFVTTNHVLHQTPFDHDVKAGCELAVNSVEVLKALAQAGVEIGAHTRTHPDLAQVKQRDKLYDEIVVATEELQKAIDRPIRYFAFPFGQIDNVSVEALRVARESGFAGICTAYGGWNNIGEDPFHMRRFSGDPRISNVKNWLTLDPRKRRSAADLPMATMLRESAALRRNEPKKSVVLQ